MSIYEADPGRFDKQFKNIPEETIADAILNLNLQKSDLSDTGSRIFRRNPGLLYLVSLREGAITRPESGIPEGTYRRGLMIGNTALGYLSEAERILLPLVDEAAVEKYLLDLKKELKMNMSMSIYELAESRYQTMTRKVPSLALVTDSLISGQADPSILRMGAADNYFVTRWAAQVSSTYSQSPFTALHQLSPS